MGGETSLSHLSDRHLAELFEARRHDKRFLELLNEELKQRSSDEANTLHLKVAALRRSLSSDRRSNSAQARGLGPVRTWLQAFFGARGMERPDGRPLYRYQMRDVEYGRAKHLLHVLARTGRLSSPDRRAGALFVAFCAEWFRREAESTFLVWDKLAPDLFPSVPYTSKQKLTKLGLQYWGRELRRSEHAREFLLTLALEGGLPSRVLTEKERGWLRAYLRTIMRSAISGGADAHERILLIASEERERVPKSYRRDDFVELCAELAEKLLYLRNEAEKASGGRMSNSSILDAIHPDWFEELPLYVSTENRAPVLELLTGLLDERIEGLTTEGVEVRRLLVQRDGKWQPAIQILADGEVPVSRLPVASSNARLRAIPSGELGKHLSGELALLEPPTGEQKRWRVHPLSRISEVIAGYLFEEPVAVSLTSPEEAPVLWTWPRGERLCSDLLVFQEHEETARGEKLLRFIRAGSVSSSANHLYVLVPSHWIVEPACDGAIDSVDETWTGDRQLIRIKGTVYFSSDTAETRFRVEPGADDRIQQLHLPSAHGNGFDLSEKAVEIAYVPFTPRVREGEKGSPRDPRSGEFFWRRPGERGWQPLENALTDSGLFELSWRDPQAGIQIEKRVVALFPQDAAVRGDMKTMNSAVIRLENLPDWTIKTSDTSFSSEQVQPGMWEIQFKGRPVYYLPLELQPPAGPSIKTRVHLTGRDACIVLENGLLLQPRSRIDLSQLRGAIALSPRPTTLNITPKGSRTGFRRQVEGELPLGILREAVGEMLAIMPSQDGVLELEFIGDFRPPIHVSRYRYGQLSIDGDRIHWHAPADGSIRLVGRMILNPRKEFALEEEAPGIWHLPDACSGPCLAYLRDGIDVVSRPLPIVRPARDQVTGFSENLLIGDVEARQNALLQALESFGASHEERDVLAWLQDAVLNLNGLPASAFDALKLLPRVPEAALRLLISASNEADRGVIWALQNELPFLWLGVPLSAWAAVLDAECSAIRKLLEPLQGPQFAMGVALDRLKKVQQHLVAFEPALDWIFTQFDLPPVSVDERVPLRELTSAFITSHSHHGSESPNEMGKYLESKGFKLHPEILSKSHEHFAGLFAPVLLALSALGKLRLSQSAMLLVRRTLRSDPQYVTGAWAHFLEFYN
ncbi:STY4851/ECs_5259 family protein [Chelativorans sp. SCAU2101]|uniref:STY4851/ECs_5259 family protein n=1 Tax=Chelativorans petroleitrophicus TaxID=2975484 RepID=A0A9X2XCV3_9HYPH|nr:STY4851/ECs_5259 family protein [Chelativorans petroleitrophicus]